MISSFKLLFCSIILFCSSVVYGQQQKNKSLENYVDSVFTTQLGYEYDSNSYLKPNKKTIQVDTTVKGIVDYASSPLPANPPPIIVVDQIPVKKERLTNLTLEMVEKIAVLKNENSTALYGQSGKNGAVIITTKQPKKTKQLLLKTHDGM